MNHGSLVSHMASRSNDKDARNRSKTTGAVDDAAEVPRDDDPDTSANEAADEQSTANADLLAQLTEEKNALQDRLLRLAAEFDNYRKRVDRDRRDQADAAVASAVEDLLPIVDNLERALEAPAGEDTDSYRQGVELIHRQMLDVLRRRGVTPIESVGTDFDPQVHQAVAHEASPEHREGEVMEEFRRGYQLDDRLLRHAMVKVAKA